MAKNKSNKSSFVFYETFFEMIHKLPDDLRLKFYDYIANYGLFGIEPVVEGLEESIWGQIKNGIDSAKAKYNASVQNGYKGGRPPKNPIEPSENLEKPNITYFNPKEPSKTINDNDNVNENVNGEREFLSPSVDLDINIPKDYAKQVFDILKDNNLPCCLGNYISFMQSDFKFALETLHSRADLRGLHSDMVLGALKNYALVINNPNTWQGWKNKKSFDRFVSWERFKDFLPDRFCLDNFLDRSAASPPKQAQSKGVGLNRALEILEEVQNEKKRVHG